MNGKAHASASAAIAAVTSLTAPVIITLGAPIGYVMLPIGALAGIMITPDLDMYDYVKAGTYSKALIRQKIGKLPAFVWTLFWMPYGRAIPHRSWVSHAPIVGTIIRMLYLAIFPLLALFLLDMGHIVPIVVKNAWFAFFLVGLVLSDTAHWIMDWKIWRLLK